MAYIVVGYSTGLMNKKFLGIKPCANCGKFSEYYLSKSYFRINLFWFIPIFGVPTGKHLRCANCNGTRKLTAAEWREYKEKAIGMPKKKQYRKAYEELKKLVIEASASELDVPTIYNRLLGRLDFADEGGHIRELVAVYLANSQNAANIVAAANQPAGEAIEGETEAARAIGDTRTDAPAEAAPAAPAPIDLANVPTSVNGFSSLPISITGDPAPAYTATDASAAAPTYSGVSGRNYTYTDEAKNSKKGSGWRRLWIVPAVILAMVTLLMAVSTVAVLTEEPTGIGIAIVTALVTVGIPLALTVLFFRLAFKK